MIQQSTLTSLNMLYVFAGPTLSKEEIIALHPNAVVRDPIKSADILNLLRHSKKELYPSNILIIDGLFHGHLSIRHKEILYAINMGIQVWGSSSMGALRAAECNKYGMQGVGKIFDFFSSNLCTSDDEVAVSYSSEKPYQELSLPLINLRFAIDIMLNNEEIDKQQSKEIMEELKSFHFSDRKYEIFAQNKILNPYIDSIKKNYVNWKRVDALQALKEIGLKITRQENQTKNNWTLNQGMIPLNYYKDTLTTSETNSEHLIGDELVKRIGMINEGERLLYDSYNRLLTLRFARLLNVKPSEEEINSFYVVLDDLMTQEYSTELPYSCNFNDPTFKRKVAYQEATILKIHLWLNETLGVIGSSLPLQDYLTKLTIIEGYRKSKKIPSLSKILKGFCANEEINMQQVFFELDENSSNRQGRSNNHMDV